MYRIAAVLKLFSQLNKFSSNNFIRHGTKTVSVADVSLFYLTVTKKRAVDALLLIKLLRVSLISNAIKHINENK